MSSNVQIYDDSESIGVSDVTVHSLDINDILAGGTIAISSAVSILEGGTITTAPNVETITPSADINVKVSVTVEAPNQVQISISGDNEVSIADVASLGPTGATGTQGPSGVGVFNDLIGNPFRANGTETEYKVGLNLTNPQYELELTSTLFSPVVSSSAVAINGNGASDLFIVKLNNEAESKFIINLQGVTILGQFETTPTAVDGGMFYSSSGEFYLGS